MRNSKVFRFRYWMVDFESFAFWFSVAFVAGAGPNLADNFGIWGLVSIWILMGIVAVVLWYKNKRKYGVGIYISLPSKNDGKKESSLPSSVRKAMNRSHRDWFIYGPDKLMGSEYKRARWVINTIEHRINEAQIKNQEDEPLFLYIHSRLPEAFAVGQRAAVLWKENSIREEGYEHPPYPLSIDFRVRSFTVYGGRERIYELNLRKIFSEKYRELGQDCCRHRFESIDLKKKREDNGLPSLEKSQLAVILHVESVEGSANAFRDGAVLASAGVANNGYMVMEEDKCDQAVFFSINANCFFEKLVNGEAESTICEVLHKCQEYNARLHGRRDVPVRLFTNIPSVFAFAAGAYFPDGSRIVRYSQSYVEYSRWTGNEIVAIVDGDDVGEQTERSLLSRDLDNAVMWSKKADQSLRDIVEKMQNLSGVSLVSKGGDSAIFSLRSSSLSEFLEFLDILRMDTGFRVSCGYGTDSREAFNSLRVAKTSGKNISVGIY